MCIRLEVRQRLLDDKWRQVTLVRDEESQMHDTGIRTLLQKKTLEIATVADETLVRDEESQTHDMDIRTILN